ncbi:SDR family oxidoreductase [Neomicrococcus lactis]|uniref:NAD(P)-dependent dehydrogenase (Short-subunit alcohol dehydrogenase family) n=1 Tax=Neomicrococcus lactis TaxID=732241 RepID=A0A7W9DBZ3_9MICC|nr:SDR family oxidoreductase [Neomicrococcus lactis]MBB5598611.1 NAD(P)-dependent dehydrogenase (short-subunit alcohol dehydrogenase family) [Neomicrococcus lactis]
MARTYIITGAGSGIGKKTAEILRERGETVVGVDLRGTDVEGDLGTPEGRQKAVQDSLAAAGGKVDAVIACAGISHPIPATAAINYFGMTEFLEGLRPVLAESDAPRAALVSSMSSLQPQFTPLTEALLSNDEAKALEIAAQLAEDPRGGSMIYSSSKRAISRWVRAQSVTPEWAGVGIPLNAVGPGIVTTPMTADLLSNEQGVKMVDSVVPMPLNYHQPPESIANLLIWLTSVENTHCAGQTIYCDGGADVVLRGEDAWSWADERVLEYFSKLG